MAAGEPDHVISPISPPREKQQCTLPSSTNLQATSHKPQATSHKKLTQARTRMPPPPLLSPLPQPAAPQGLRHLGHLLAPVHPRHAGPHGERVHRPRPRHRVAQPGLRAAGLSLGISSFTSINQQQSSNQSNHTIISSLEHRSNPIKLKLFATPAHANAAKNTRVPTPHKRGWPKRRAPLPSRPTHEGQIVPSTRNPSPATAGRGPRYDGPFGAKRVLRVTS